MLGLGETVDEVHKAMDDLVENGLDILTLGQYLQPTKMHIEVAEFIHPDQFEKIQRRRVAPRTEICGIRAISKIILPCRAVM